VSPFVFRFGKRSILYRDCPVRGVPIPDEVTRRTIPRERLGDLARYPLRGRIFRHAKRNPKPTSMTQDDKTIEDLERDRRQNKEVNRRDAVGVVPEKRPPALRRWPPTLAHVASDCRLGDLQAELKQLTMNAWRTSQRVGTAHLPNKLAQLSRDLRPANTVAGSPPPIGPKAGAVPADDGLRPDNRNRLKDGRKPAIEPSEKPRAIPGAPGRGGPARAPRF
jgi:hypothetical protein